MSATVDTFTVRALGTVAWFKYLGDSKLFAGLAYYLRKNRAWASTPDEGRGDHCFVWGVALSMVKRLDKLKPRKGYFYAKRVRVLAWSRVEAMLAHEAAHGIMGAQKTSDGFVFPELAGEGRGADGGLRHSAHPDIMCPKALSATTDLRGLVDEFRRWQREGRIVFIKG